MKLYHVTKFGEHWIKYFVIDELVADPLQAANYLTEEEFSQQYCDWDCTYQGSNIWMALSPALKNSIFQTMQNGQTMKCPDETNRKLWIATLESFRHSIQREHYSRAKGILAPKDKTKLAATKLYTAKLVAANALMHVVWERISDAPFKARRLITPTKQETHNNIVNFVTYAKKAKSWADIQAVIGDNCWLNEQAPLMKKLWVSPKKFFE